MNATLKKFFSGWAMKLTILRVALIPLFIITYYFHPESWQQWLSLWVYTIACISDFLDGWLARHLKEESAFGAFLDPVADKLMVAAVLTLLSMWQYTAAAYRYFREAMTTATPH